MLSSHQRPPNGGIFYYFLYCDLIEYQAIGNQKAPLLRIMPADESDTSQVETIQFEHLYYYRITKDIISHIVPEIRSEFGELIQFKYADPLYVFHFRPIGYGVVQIEVSRNVRLVQILFTTVHIYKMYDLNLATYYTHQLKGNLNYPIYQSGRGLGSRLFNIVKSVGARLLKEIILPTVNAEAGQVIQDITSGVGVKNALMRGAKRAGKSILKRGTQCLMKDKGRKRKRDPSTALGLMLKSINSAKRRRI